MDKRNTTKLMTSTLTSRKLREYSVLQLKSHSGLRFPTAARLMITTKLSNQMLILRYAR